MAIFDKEKNLISDYYADDILKLSEIYNLYSNIAFIGDGAKLLNNLDKFDNTIYSKNIGLAGYKEYLKGHTTNADNLSVMYLKPSQAERMRNV